MNHISANVAQNLKSFVKWMAHEKRPHYLHVDYLATLTSEDYFQFRLLPPSYHEPQQLMTSFPSEFK